jgi:hypothetical protein
MSKRRCTRGRESGMDRLTVSMDVLRRLANEADNPNCMVLAERAINDYLKSEIDALKAAIERIGKAVDEDAAKGRGEDWSLPPTMWAVYAMCWNQKAEFYWTNATRPRVGKKNCRMIFGSNRQL